MLSPLHSFQPFSQPVPSLKLADGRMLAFQSPRIMGILNITPDSFSDGGRCMTADTALTQAENLLREGADILDIGGESTRPEATPVPAKEEMQRVLPVISAIRKHFPDALLSLDTRHAETAAAAADQGIDLLNDVSALAERDSAYLNVLCRTRIPCVLTASRPLSGEPVPALLSFFRETLAWLASGGIPAESLILDPGIGFHKSPAENAAAIHAIPHLRNLFSRPVLLGHSRKSCLGQWTGRPLAERENATTALSGMALLLGASILRVHSASAAKDAVSLFTLLQKTFPLHPEI